MYKHNKAQQSKNRVHIFGIYCTSDMAPDIVTSERILCVGMDTFYSEFAYDEIVVKWSLQVVAISYLPG